MTMCEEELVRERFCKQQQAKRILSIFTGHLNGWILDISTERNENRKETEIDMLMTSDECNVSEQAKEEKKCSLMME